MFVYCCFDLPTKLAVKIGKPHSNRDKRIPCFLNCHLVLFAILFFAVLATCFLLPVLLLRNKTPRTTAATYAETCNVLAW